MTRPDVVWSLAIDYAETAISKIDAGRASVAYAKGLSDAFDAVHELQDRLPDDVDVRASSFTWTLFWTIVAGNVVGLAVGMLLVLEGVF